MGVLPQKNQIYENVLVEAMTGEGSGIVRLDGFAVFVPGTIKGERVDIKIIAVRKNFAAGKLLKLREASPDRVLPDCPVYNSCGGCALSHMSYEAQLRLKTENVDDALTRIGKQKLPPHRPCIGLNNGGYRNKVQLPLCYTKDGISLGFFREASHNVIAIKGCGIQHPAIESALPIIKEAINKYPATLYDENTGKGLLRQVMLRCNMSGELMVCLVLNGRSYPDEERLTAYLAGRLPQLRSLMINTNRERGNTILGKENRVLHGFDHITEALCGINFDISVNSFFQVNPPMAEWLYRQALEYAAAGGDTMLADAFCGTGTISLIMSSGVKYVYGLELEHSAVCDARANADRAGITNVRFIEGDCGVTFPELMSGYIGTESVVPPNAVILDPPRKGCSEGVLRSLGSSGIEKIVYISCNPGTLARDVGILSGYGYSLSAMQAFDMFPQTGHVETVVSLSR